MNLKQIVCISICIAILAISSISVYQPTNYELPDYELPDVIEGRCVGKTQTDSRFKEVVIESEDGYFTVPVTETQFEQIKYTIFYRFEKARFGFGKYDISEMSLEEIEYFK